MISVEEIFPSNILKLISKFNFKIIEEFYVEKIFGNAFIIIENKEMALRFTKDRSQFFIDMRSLDENNWHQFIRVAEFLHIDIKNPIDIEEQIVQFENNYSGFCKIFENIELRKKFEAFERERNQLAMDQIFKNK